MSTVPVVVAQANTERTFPTTDTSFIWPNTLSSLDKRILIICQGNLPLYREALSEINPKNISIVVCQEDDSLSQHKTFAIVHYVKEFFSSGEVERICFDLLKANSFTLIVAPSETDILRAAKLRDIFHLEGQSYESALFFRDKIRMKTLLKKNEIEVPAFTRVKSALDVLNFVDHHSYPFIVKPSRGYGSIQTHILRNPQDTILLLDTKDIFNEFHQADLDLEQFIEGDMYHVDGIVRDGKVLAIWPSKCINNCLQMVEGKPTGGYLLSADNPITLMLNQYTRKILEILPMPSNSGFHLELFYNDNKVIFCEIASRIGSPWINDLWVNGMGINLKKEFIRAQAYLPSLHNFDSCSPSKLIGGMIFPPKPGKVISIPASCKLEGVIEYTPLVRVGAHLEQPNGMIGHIASFTIFANSENQMKEKVKLVQEWFEANFKIIES